MVTRRHFGSVRKRSSGRWQATYWHDGRLHSAGTFSAKADAQAHLSTVEADLRRGAWIDPRAGQVSVSTYSDEWLAGRSDLAARTRELYRHQLDRHIFPPLGAATLSALTPSRIREWHASLAQDHPSTAAKSYRLLSTIMRTAVVDGVIVSSPCKVQGGGVERAPERPIASIAEIEALANAMPERLRLLVQLAALCQLRRAELLGLSRRDVDLLHSTVRIERSRTFTMTGESLVKEPKSAAGRRTLAVPEHLLSAVEKHLDQFVASDPDAPLFANVSGKPLTKSVLQSAWNRTRRSIGREDLHLHDLRHTGLTLAAAMGATTAELMRRAGHSSATASLRYQH